MIAATSQSWLAIVLDPPYQVVTVSSVAAEKAYDTKPNVVYGTLDAYAQCEAGGMSQVPEPRFSRGGSARLDSTLYIIPARHTACLCYLGLFTYV
jgi:hypothetical protein